jgi:hypothetical protein
LDLTTFTRTFGLQSPVSIRSIYGVTWVLTSAQAHWSPLGASAPSPGPCHYLGTPPNTHTPLLHGAGGKSGRETAFFL